MAVYVVTLDGGEEQPERSCELTVEAKTQLEAEAKAEKANPGLEATGSRKA
jgi:hypothetical protein